VKPKISILLPAYKSKDLISKIFLPSFRKHCSTDVELIIYNNGGNQIYKDCFVDTPTLEIEKNVKIIGDGKNIGLNAALNICAKVARGDYFYLSHSDMYLLPGWDTALLDATKNMPPGKQLFCSRSIEPNRGHTDHHIIKNYGMEWREFKEKELLEDFKDYKCNNIVTGKRMPFFMHKILWNKMGGVDENYFSYCTDDDLIQEAYDCGVRRFWMVYGSLVYHLQGKSNQQQTVDKDSDKPYKYFVEKWKKRGYEQSCHPGYWHDKLIPNYVKVR
jgi:GT2 family glycosyltransferase